MVTMPSREHRYTVAAVRANAVLLLPERQQTPFPHEIAFHLHVEACFKVRFPRGIKRVRLLADKPGSPAICLPPLSLTMFFRDEGPGGRLLAFAWGDVASRLNPYSSHDGTAFAFSAISYSHPHRLALRLAFPCGRGTGLPRSARMPG